MTYDNDEAYDFDNDPEWVAFYWQEREREERERAAQNYTPGDRWSDPECADPDALEINWL